MVKHLVCGLLSALVVLPVASYAVPVASGSISANCQQGAVYDGGSVSSSASFACSYPLPGNVSVSATTSANFLTTPSMSAGASAGGTALAMNAQAAGGGVMQYYMQVVPLTAPPTAPATIPVIFSAQGGISISGGPYASLSSATASAAVVNATGTPLAFPTDAFSVNAQYPASGEASAGFDQTTTLDLLPSPDLYRINLVSACQAHAVVPVDPNTTTPVTVSANCSSHVDPAFAFDQGAFDAQMGAGTFALANYYKLELSPNLVPLPSSLPLMGTGVALLAGILGWRGNSKGSLTA